MHGLPLLRWSSVVAAAAGALLKFVDSLRCFGLGQFLVDGLAGLLCERPQVRRLRAGHALIAGNPLVRVLLRIVGGRLILALLCHLSVLHMIRARGGDRRSVASAS